MKLPLSALLSQAYVAFAIVQSCEGMASPLLRALAPYPDGWRAQLPPLNGLPHFPMESHRGGFPDGS